MVKIQDSIALKGKTRHFFFGVLQLFLHCLTFSIITIQCKLRLARIAENIINNIFLLLSKVLQFAKI